MNKINTFLYILFILLFGECGRSDHPANYVVPKDSIGLSSTIHDSLVKPSVDEESIANIDTTFTISVNNRSYMLIITRDEFRSTENYNFSTFTIRILDSINHDTLILKTLDGNTILSFTEPAPGNYWLTLVQDAGGSGYSGTIYLVRISPKPILQPLLNINELTYCKSNNKGDEFLLFQAFWNSNYSNAEDFEAHFSPHEQQIFAYTITEDTVIPKKIGLTRHKYDLALGNRTKTLQEIKQKELDISKKIKWEDYQ